MMQIERDPMRLQQEALARRARGERIGFVPTMGYLHAGHLSLMKLARQQCDWLVTSIYVNPLQFGPTEDLDQYPRDFEGDADKCRSADVDMLFCPENLYPADHSTTVAVSKLTRGMCGETRPGHFDGVTTVVARLFGLVQPNLAIFGEKDYQQLAVIRRMTRDLAIPVDVQGGPLIRDHDGLALSSRNRYLSEEERQRGRSLHQALLAIREAVAEHGPGMDVTKLLEIGRSRIQSNRIDYLSIVDAQTLLPTDRVTREARVLVAAFFGKTRLIDNVALIP